MKTYIFNHFYQQYLVLFTMVPPDSSSPATVKELVQDLHMYHTNSEQCRSDTPGGHGAITRQQGNTSYCGMGPPTITIRTFYPSMFTYKWFLHLGTEWYDVRHGRKNYSWMIYLTREVSRSRTVGMQMGFRQRCEMFTFQEIAYGTPCIHTRTYTKLYIYIYICLLRGAIVNRTYGIHENLYI